MIIYQYSLISIKKSQLMSLISFNEFQCKYRFDCQLSQGSFGKVCRIQQIKTRKYFALKKITVKKKQQLDEIQNEIRLLQRYRHPYVVQIKQTYNIQIQNGFDKPIWEVGIILELAKCSLQQLIRLNKTMGSFQFIAQQAVGLIKVLFILQKQNIVHRDIKPANILIFETTQNSTQWKLADFGLSLDLSNLKETENFAGSFEYASPKLKRKFKYPNLKMKTNNYKDDVYSLGVTLLQTITGLRNYNNYASDKLRQICPDKKFVELIDMMLEQDEEKRPCFKQLMILIQKDFHEISSLQQQQPQNIRQKNKVQLSKKKYSFHQQNLVKTQVKKQQRVLKKSLLKVGKPIQCIALLDGAFMCGCDNGELVIIANNLIIQCGFIHKRNVTQLFVDSKDNIWSIGGDSTIKKWSKTHLIKALLTQVKKTTIIQDNFLRKNQEKVIFTLEIKESYYEELQLPFYHKCGISTIYVIDKQNFAVGYFNGYVYIRWRGNQFHCQIFKNVVTSIKSSSKGQTLWICSIDGLLKSVHAQNLTLSNKFYYNTNNTSFVDLYIHQNKHEQSISLLTMDGRHLILNKNLECIYDNIIGKQMIMSSAINNKNGFLLMETGQIYDLNEEKLTELDSRGWSCMALSAQNEIVAGSFLGYVAFIQY